MIRELLRKITAIAMVAAVSGCASRPIIVSAVDAYPEPRDHPVVAAMNRAAAERAALEASIEERDQKAEHSSLAREIGDAVAGAIVQSRGTSVETTALPQEPAVTPVRSTLPVSAESGTPEEPPVPPSRTSVPQPSEDERSPPDRRPQGPRLKPGSYEPHAEFAQLDSMPLGTVFVDAQGKWWRKMLRDGQPYFRLNFAPDFEMKEGDVHDVWHSTFVVAELGGSLALLELPAHARR